MKTNELRIGNWVQWNIESGPENALVSAISKDEIFFKCGDSDIVERISGILLTEEWLLKFDMELTDGFSSSRKLYLNNYEYDISKITYSPKEGLLRLLNGDTKGTMLIPHIKYVHQLQNIYFALAGEELTFKSE
jgi:hypothetical protein